MIQISLRKNARTTPAVRAKITANSETTRVLAECHDIGEQTICKWKSVTASMAAPTRAYRLRIQIPPAQEIVVMYLRRALLLPFDDLLAGMRAICIPLKPGARRMPLK